MGRDGEFFEEAERVVENDYAVGFVVSGAGDLNLANTMSAQPRQDMFLHLDFYIDRLVTGLSYEHNQVFGQIEIKSRTWLTLSLDKTLQYSRGGQVNARTTVLPAPPKPMSQQEIIKLREQFNCSQAVFARLLNVSVKTLQAWEQGVRVPSDAALKLPTIAKHHPKVLLS